MVNQNYKTIFKKQLFDLYFMQSNILDGLNRLPTVSTIQNEDPFFLRKITENIYWKYSKCYLFGDKQIILCN